MAPKFRWIGAPLPGTRPDVLLPTAPRPFKLLTLLELEREVPTTTDGPTALFPDKPCLPGGNPPPITVPPIAPTPTSPIAPTSPVDVGVGLLSGGTGAPLAEDTDEVGEDVAVPP